MFDRAMRFKQDQGPLVVLKRVIELWFVGMPETDEVRRNDLTLVQQKRHHIAPQATRGRLRKARSRKVVNSGTFISPDAMANSLCWNLPEFPTWPSIGTLQGGLLKTMRASAPSISSPTTRGSSASPQISRCRPSCQRSPEQTLRCASLGDASSSGVARLFRCHRFWHALELRNREPDDRDIKAQICGHQRTEICRQQVLIPLSVQRQYIVRQHIAALMN